MKILTTETSTVYTESLLAGTIAMALCYIARILRTKTPGLKVKFSCKYELNIFTSFFIK